MPDLTAEGSTVLTWTDQAPDDHASLSFAHLFRLSDHGGLFEHAEFTRPRPEHGYCVDDIARGLIVIAREPAPDQRLRDLADFYLWLVTDAQTPDGRFHNRRSVALEWTDEATVEDCWGRAVWGLGSAAARLPEASDSSTLARWHAELSLGQRSPDLRAMCFAALGAAEMLQRWPDHAAARSLLTDAAALVMSTTDPTGDWPWPEPRLRYANAAVPEVLLAAGRLLGDPALLDAGQRVLDWLLAIETAGDHLSVTPVGGWGAGEPRPAFDQQPIEVAALADACALAFAITGDERWADAVELCQAWFFGSNDCRVSLLDEASGGGCDGLMSTGRNENQGAESTLSAMTTIQQAQRLRARLRAGDLIETPAA